MRRPAGLPPRAELRATLTDRESIQRILDDGEMEECECFRRRGHSRTRPPRSQALERPHFFYRNQPVNRRFTPRYRRRAPGLYIAPVARKHAPAGGRYEDAAIPEIAGAAASGNGNTILSERAFAAA